MSTCNWFMLEKEKEKNSPYSVQKCPKTLVGQQEHKINLDCNEEVHWSIKNFYSR